jgi:hypothetical protein
MSHDPFHYAAAKPFNPAADAGNLTNALWLADCARLAYSAPISSFPSFANGGFPDPADRDTQFFKNNEGTEAYLLDGGSFAVVAYRGTEAMLTDKPLNQLGIALQSFSDDLWTDAKFRLTRWPSGGMVHTGFRDSLLADDLHRRILVRLDAMRASIPELTVWFTGHSLGGALATLAAHADSNANSRLVTFGCPRVGNHAFTEAMRVPVSRFVNADDTVNRIPLSRMGYEHCGATRQFDSAGVLHNDGIPAPEQPAGRLFERLNQVRQRIQNELFSIQAGFEDHDMGKYLAKLLNLVLEPAPGLPRD